MAAKRKTKSKAKAKAKAKPKSVVSSEVLTVFQVFGSAVGAMSEDGRRVKVFVRDPDAYGVGSVIHAKPGTSGAYYETQTPKVRRVEEYDPERHG